jgi:aspartate-semialdehyde dehydrogenase
LAASANCSTTQLALALKPLEASFGLRRVVVMTMQAVSGAGYPGVPSLDILGNVIPHIAGEEEKVEGELLKLLGTRENGRIKARPIAVSAQCNRVPVRNGHTECVSVELERKANPQQVMAALDDFRGPPIVAGLPSSPDQPLRVFREPDRPQPLRDRGAGQGMVVCVGRVRTCPVLGTKFVVLGHNTVRGAAGGAIHNAELLVAQNWIE